jgi:3-oxoadipate enol-lactonase
VIAMVRATPLHGYLAALAAIRDMDLREAIRSIRNKVLVIAGRHDPSTPPGMGALVASSIEGAKYVTLDASHLLNIEDEANFTKTVVDFLTAPETTAAKPPPRPRAPAKKAPAKKAPARKTTAKKALAKKAVAKKIAKTKRAGKRASAKKAPAKPATARKPAARTIQEKRPGTKKGVKKKTILYLTCPAARCRPKTERYTYGRREPWTPRHFSSLLFLLSSLGEAAGTAGGAGFRRVAVLTRTF